MLLLSMFEHKRRVFWWGGLFMRHYVGILLLGLSCSILAASQPSSKLLKLAAFDGVEVSQSINVTMIGGQKHHVVELLGKPEAIAQVLATVDHGILKLTSADAKGNVRVRMLINTLNRLTLSDTSQVAGTNIHSKGLVIRDSSSGKLRLRGIFPVKQIDQSGNGEIDLQWLNSQEIVVDLRDKAKLRLAGVASELYAKLSDQAELDAIGLRTKHLWVRTQQIAVARVLPVDSLKAFANDQSNIFYYKTPGQLQRDTSESGNVLQADSRP